MTVKAIEPHQSMVWVSQNKQGQDIFTWVWELVPLDEKRTRLITRLRVRYHGGWPDIILDFLVFDFGDFIMMRKCLLGIKRRAETLAREKGQTDSN